VLRVARELGHGLSAETPAVSHNESRVTEDVW
jgi:hypothetical protein